jgi:hypothetical protein
MKIAIAFHGKFTGKNSRGELQGFKKPFKLLSRNFDLGNADIYFHGWDDDKRASKKLVELYKPKAYLLEKQITFHHNYRYYNFVPTGPWNTQGSLSNLYSRFYSLMQSVNLIKDEYDLVLVSRFDTVFYENLPLEILDLENFYASNWNLNHEGWGLNDAWFISGKENITKFSEIYYALDSYFDAGQSNYIEFLRSKSLTLESMTSAHAICRYRCVELGLEDRLYGVGLEYVTWGLLRRYGKRRDPWGYSGPDVRIPTLIK